MGKIELREAMLWEPYEKGKVKCKLCAHRCIIPTGRRGFCGVRENREGTLFSLVYGKAITVNIDPIEKKPFFHFLPSSASYSIATVGCNFHCDFCQNWDISQASVLSVSNILGKNNVLPERIVEEAIRYKCRSISYTYTEPTVFFEYAYDTAKLAKKNGLKNNFVTNGYQTKEALDLMKDLVDAANIDLKSFSDEFYKKFCKAKLNPVLETIKNMKKAGIWVEVTTLLVPSQNDSKDELGKIVEFLASISKDIPWHISRFYPHYKMENLPPAPERKILEAIEIGKKSGLNYVYAGNLPGSKFENSFCPYCGKEVISRVGFMVNAIELDNNSCCKFCREELPFVL